MALLVKVVAILIDEWLHAQDARKVGVVISKDERSDRGDAAEKDRPLVGAEVEAECLEHLDEGCSCQGKECRGSKDEAEGSKESGKARGRARLPVVWVRGETWSLCRIE